jgi:hypothetical protein
MTSSDELSRRKLLGSFVGGAGVGIGGQWLWNNRWWRDDIIENPPDGIHSLSFITGDVAKHTVSDPLASEIPPDIRYGSPYQELEIAGVYPTGAEDCYEVVIQNLEYTLAEELYVEISDTNTLGLLDKIRNKQCTLTVNLVPYRLRILFEAAPPITVRAEEIRDGENTISEVDR